MAGNYLSFADSVETGLTKPKTSVGPVWRDAPKNGMKNAGRGKGVVRTVNPKLTGEAVKKGAPKIIGKAGRAIGRAAAPLAVAEQAYRVGKLATDENARAESEKDYEDMADDGFFTRLGKGALGGVDTIYGMGKAIVDTVGANSRASESDRAYEEKMKDPAMQRIVQNVKNRQSTYMEQPKEERDKVDDMTPKDAGKFIQDKVDTKSAAKSATGPSRFEYFRELTKAADAAPKAIPVAEPAEVDMDRAMALFKNTHGGPFDPKSSMDKGKMEVIQNLMRDKGTEKLTPNQFSLQVYRQSK